MFHARVRGARLVLTLLFGVILLAMLSASSVASAGPVLPIPDTLWKPADGSVPTSGNYVYLDSDPGDFIGAGGKYLYTQADAVIGLSPDGGSLNVQVTGDERWHGVFLVSNDLTRFEPGYYPGLREFGSMDPDGSLSWWGEYSYPYDTGWLIVDSVTYTGGQLTAIDLRFEQHSGTATPALHGAIHWRADDPTQPPGPVLPIPDTLWRPAAGSVPATGNYVYLDSDAGDVVGGGQKYLFTQLDSVISVQGGGGLFSIQVRFDQTWAGNFQAMTGPSRLEPGYYPDLRGYPWHNPAKGGLNWSGPLGSSTSLSGWFVVDDVKYSDGELASIDLRFEQRSNGSTAALHGAIHWTPDDKTHPPGPVVPVPDTLWKPAADSVPEAGNYVYLDSDPGDYIGAGREYLYTRDNAALTVTASGGHLTVKVKGDEEWSGDFQTMDWLQSVAPGFYPDLRRYTFHDPTKGGLDWWGEGRGSNTVKGWFAVDDATYDASGTLTSIDLRFEQHSGDVTPALRGAIRWEMFVPASVDGVVRNADRSGLEGIDVAAYRRDMYGDWEYVDDISTDLDGSYRFDGLDWGTYRIEFADYSGEYLDQWYGGATSMESAKDVVVVRGSTTSGVDATLRRAGHVTGTVRDPRGAGLGDIDVVAWQADGSGGWLPVNGTGTTVDGRYDLGGLDTGTYRIEFYDWSGDHVAQWYEGQTGPAAAKDVVVTAGEKTGGVDAVLADASHVTGTVRTSGGTALGGIDVTVYRPDGSGGWDYVNDVETEEDGTYDLGGLPAGTYRVEFDDWSETYGTQCYNGRPDLASATDIVVAARGTTGGIDATLSAPGHIKGKVTRANQTGLEDIAVVAYRRDEHGKWQYLMEGWTAWNGSFDLSIPRSGSCRLQFVDYSGVYGAQWYGNQPTLAAATDVAVVAGSSTTGINATLTTAGHITGVVRTAGNAGLQDVDVIAFQPDGYGGWIYVNDVATNASGAYDLGGLATGTYRLEFDDFSGHGYASQFFDNQPSLQAADDVAVTAGAATASVNAVLGVHAGDTTAPTTVVSGAGAAWFKTGLVTLTATDNAGGSGVQRTEYRVHGSKTWTLYLAPILVTAEGSTLYDYRSVDAAQNAEPIGSFTVNVDSITPVAGATGAIDGAWLRRSATVVLTGSDAPGSSGIASLTYTLDGTTWTARAASTSISLPAKPNATHTLSYFATDQAGNSSPQQQLTLHIDTTGPVTAAKAAGGTVGKAIALRCRITDNLSPQATRIAVVVKNARNKVVKTLSVAKRGTGTWFSVRWRPKAKGNYSYSVLASDLAGNRQSKAGSARLTVR